MKRAVQWVILFICGILIVSFSRSVSMLLTKGNVMEEARNRLERAHKERANLQKELGEVQSSAFIEKQAREKLNMAKKGEIVVIVPLVTIVPTPIPTQPLAVWERWVDVFR